MFACLSTAGRDDVGCGAVVVVQVLAPLRLPHSAHNRHPSNWPRPGRPPLVPPTPVQAGAANSQLVPLLSLPTVNWSKILSLPTVNWALSLLPNKRFTLICHLATVDWGRANNIQRVRGSGLPVRPVSESKSWLSSASSQISLWWVFIFHSVGEKQLILFHFVDVLAW